jgi:transcriptional regulator with XRE-family HTH domain
MRIGTVLKHWRENNSLSLRDAAKMMRLDKTTYLRVESGKIPSAETLRAILTFLLADE